MTHKGHPGRSSLSKLHLIFDLDCCTLTTATKNSTECAVAIHAFCTVLPNGLCVLRASPERGRMAKRKHRMVPRRPAVLLALLASASHQTLLAALTVGSLNTALVSSASAATCVTGVTSTFANAVNDVIGQPGATVVTGITPTFSNAVTGVTAPPQTVVTNVGVGPPGTFLTSGTSLTTPSTNAITSVTPNTGTAVTNVGASTGTVTGITPTPGAPTNLCS